METAIVTGVTGQMGSYLAEFLLKKSIRVIGAMRRLSIPNIQNIKHIVNSNFILEIMDLGDSHSISSLIEKYKPNYFINCAANSFVGTSWQCPEQHFEYNCLGVLRQLESIRKNSPHTKYLNFGSSEEFGDVKYTPQDENHPPSSRSPYGASKVAARQIVKVYKESYDLYAIQCWCFNYESERRGEEFVTRKISKGVARINQAIENKQSFRPIELGNLDVKRDWSHAEDFVEGVWKMLNQNAPIKNYVLSSNETHSIREFVNLAFKNANIEGSWHGNGASEELSIANYLAEEHDVKSSVLVKINPKFYRPAEVDLLLGDSSLARKELDWQPKISFQELVSRMVKNDISILTSEERSPIITDGV